MKTIESNFKNVDNYKLVINKSIDENKKHPFLERKLAKANELIKRVGLPENF